MSVVRKMINLLPSNLRRYCRDLISAELFGMPPAWSHHRDAQLRLTLDMVLAHYRLKHSKIRYIQIGAYDGVSGDPVYPLIEKYGLRGVLVEPQQYAYARLKENYKKFDGSSFALVNAAVGARDEYADFYTIREDANGPEWLHQIASFDKNTIMKHAHMVPKLESLIQSERVRCITFATLFEEVGIQDVDMLLVDAEGYDAEILHLFDVPSRKPTIVYFEHKHLSAADHEQCISLLVNNGYKISFCGIDTMAYRDVA